MTKKTKIIIGISAAVVGVGVFLYIKKRHPSSKAILNGTVNVKYLSPAQKKANFINGLSDDASAIARSYLQKVGDDTDDATVAGLTNLYTLAQLKQMYADATFPNV